MSSNSPGAADQLHNFTYDEEVDASYITLRRPIGAGEAVTQVVVEHPQLRGDVVLDLDAAGTLLGVEFIGWRSMTEPVDATAEPDIEGDDQPGLGLGGRRLAACFVRIDLSLDHGADPAGLDEAVQQAVQDGIWGEAREPLVGAELEGITSVLVGPLQPQESLAEDLGGDGRRAAFSPLLTWLEQP